MSGTGEKVGIDESPTIHHAALILLDDCLSELMCGSEVRTKEWGSLDHRNQVFNYDDVGG